MAKKANGNSGGNGTANFNKTAQIANARKAEENKKMTNEVIDEVDETTDESSEAREPKGERKIAIDSIEDAIARLVEDGHVGANLPELVKAGTVRAYKDFVQVSKNQFYGEYVRLDVGENVTDEAEVATAIEAICGGRLVAGEKDKVSLVKAALYGSDLFARNRTSQKVRTQSQGPERAFEKMVKQLMDTRGFSKEKAEAKVRAAMSDD